MVRNENMKKYLITPTLLNSWKYCVESEYGNLEDFVKVLKKEPFEPSEAIITGNEYEEYMVNNYPDTKNGCYQIKVYQNIDNFIFYGKIDCLKAGVITDYKFTRNYEVGKFYGSYQTAVYMELVPEAYKMQYIICNNFDTDKVNNNWEEDKNELRIFKEEYYREDLKVNLKQEIYKFMNWLENYDLLKIYQENWESKY